MSNGPRHKSDLDGLLSQAVRSVDLPIAMTPAATTTTNIYPESTVADILAGYERLKLDVAGGEENVLEALVDVVNRSPFPVPVWAETLGVPLVQFVATCHREQRPNGYFLDRVAEFFDQFREKPNPTWDELRPLMKTPPRTVRR